MLEPRRRIVFTMFSFSSKLEVEPDLQTGSTATLCDCVCVCVCWGAASYLELPDMPPAVVQITVGLGTVILSGKLYYLLPRKTQECEQLTGI